MFGTDRNLTASAVYPGRIGRGFGVRERDRERDRETQRQSDRDSWIVEDA